MVYDFNGKTATIPDKEINKLMKNLELTKEEAIETWLCDNGLDEDEEQEELDKTAKKIKIDKDITQNRVKKERKPIEKKISLEKQQIFQFLKENLIDFCEKNNGELQILNENKLFSLKIGEKIFKLDLIETRPKKNS